MSRPKVAPVIKNLGTYSKPQPQNKNSYAYGDKVKHKIFGVGTIVSATSMGNDTLIEIAFDGAGNKKLMANFAKLEKVQM